MQGLIIVRNKKTLGSFSFRKFHQLMRPRWHDACRSQNVSVSVFLMSRAFTAAIGTNVFVTVKGNLRIALIFLLTLILFTNR